jgi:hypothetical protein
MAVLQFDVESTVFSAGSLRGAFEFLGARAESAAHCKANDIRFLVLVSHENASWEK